MKGVMGRFFCAFARGLPVPAENTVDLSVCRTPVDIAIDCHTNPKIVDSEGTDESEQNTTYRKCEDILIYIWDVHVHGETYAMIT